ncbi:MAG: YtxH domain-containing protein [Mycoplasmatota bacterium]
MKKGKIRTFAAGAVVGIGLGFLFAPKKGSETRKDLKIKFDELLDRAKEVDVEEVKIKIETMIEDIKIELEDLDKEKVLKYAKKKASQIENMASDLVEYAVKKGTPVLEEAAKSAKEKAIEVTEEVLAKLKEETK